MTRRKASQSMKLGGLSALFLIGSAAIIFYGMLPGFGKIREYISDIQNLSQQNAVITKKIAFLNTLDETTLENQMVSLLTAVPQDKSLPTVMQVLDQVANETGVNIKSLTITNPGTLSTQSAQLSGANSAKMGSNAINFEVDTVGSLDQTNSFLDRIIGVRRMLNVGSINLSVSGSSSASATVDAKLNMMAYYAPLPTTLGKAADVLMPLTAGEVAVIDKLNTMPLELSTAAGPPTVITHADRTDPFSHR
jgi:hypothetical protein